MQNPIISALVIKSSAVLRRGKEGHVYFCSTIHTQDPSKCLRKAQKYYNITVQDFRLQVPDASEISDRSVLDQLQLCICFKMVVKIQVNLPAWIGNFN